VKVWARHPARCSNESDFLSTRDSISFRNERSAQVKVSSDDAVAVVDVDDISGQEESIDERNDSTVGCNYRRSRTSAQIDTKVAGG
jgi:hypothetical protein